MYIKSGLKMLRSAEQASAGIQTVLFFSRDLRKKERFMVSLLNVRVEKHRSAMYINKT